jgi:hypothetical protein
MYIFMHVLSEILWILIFIYSWLFNDAYGDSSYLASNKRLVGNKELESVEGTGRRMI